MIPMQFAYQMPWLEIAVEVEVANRLAGRPDGHQRLPIGSS